MTGSTTLDQDYLTLMQNHPYGKAIYKPPAVSNFHPGSIGYFDALNDWNPIVDISGAQSAWPAAFTTLPTEKLLSAASESQTWGPKVGRQTTCRKIDLKESVSLTALAGVPLEVGSCFRFETGTSAGSVLLSNGPVSHSRYYHEAPFKQWIAANAKSILIERPEVRDYGLWVVTSIWSTAEAALNCWSGRRKGVDVGFNFKVVEIGELAPKGSWCHAGESDGWIHVKANQEGEKRVLFFGGLRFRWRRILGGLKNEKQTRRLRGKEGDLYESISTFTAEGDDSRYEVTCEEALENESLRPLLPEETEESRVDRDDEDW